MPAELTTTAPTIERLEPAAAADEDGTTSAMDITFEIDEPNPDPVVRNSTPNVIRVARRSTPRTLVY